MIFKNYFNVKLYSFAFLLYLSHVLLSERSAAAMCSLQSLDKIYMSILLETLTKNLVYPTNQLHCLYDRIHANKHLRFYKKPKL